MYKKQVFTTGEVASLLHVHQTTVIEWIDKGQLEGYRTPGGHRRVSREALFRFFERHHIPIPHALTGEPSHPTAPVERERHIHDDFEKSPYAALRR